MVSIHCDRCLNGKDGAWTSDGFGAGHSRGNTCCGEKEMSIKSNCIGTTGVLGMLCTLGLLTDL